LYIERLKNERPLIITSIQENSIAEELKIQPGDDLVAVNGHTVHDILDYQFHIQDDELELEIRRGGETIVYELEDGLDEELGLQFEEMKCLACGNHCVFCFVDQNPPLVRPTLLFKDEDYRMSFIHGNYVTLTNTSRKQLHRIAEQRLSPLYISVHAVNLEVRGRLLGIRADDRLLDKIEYLAQNRIEMHTQIVLCPGWNDGAVLEETVEHLSHYFPYVNTVAIVPVGLTKHRQGLPELTPASAEKAHEILKWEKEAAAHFHKKLGSYFIYLADEFYLLANKPVPNSKRYEGFAQVENGVGMVRQLLDDFKVEKKQLPASVPSTRIDVVTGKMAAPVLEKHILPELNRVKGSTVTLQPVENKFFGGGVSVSGLLCGQDIADQLLPRPLGDLVVLPPNCLNYDGIFLDDWTVDRLAGALQRRVVQSQNGFIDLFLANR
jgi:putative radical SAM enzyme (TIGR03279 family)